MKRTLALIVLFGILFVAGIVFFISVRSSDSTDISLIKEEGKIYLKDSDSADYKEVLFNEQTIKSESFIKTDASSYGRIFLPDNSLISIDESTEIQVSYLDNKITINQIAGNTWHRVQTIDNGGVYKVQTINSVSIAKGTIFAVGSDEDGSTNVSIEEGKVNVQSLNTDSSIEEQSDLEAGDKINIPKNVKDKIKKSLIDEIFKNTDWYKRNKLVDGIYIDLKNNKVRNLRTLLREKLEISTDFDRFHFGVRTPMPAFIRLVNNNILQQPDANQIRDDLSDLYKLEKITENVCTDISPQELSTLTENVEKYRQYVSDSERILNILSTIKEGCKDKILSVEAAEKIKLLTK